MSVQGVIAFLAGQSGRLPTMLGERSDNLQKSYTRCAALFSVCTNFAYLD
jgi:hypothetical protein